MSWKKNVFSYLMWLIYAIVTGGILLAEAYVFYVGAGFDPYVGILFGVIILLLSGGIVFLLHQFAEKLISFVQKNSGVIHLLEAALAVILLAVGFMFRTGSIESAGQSSVYYDMAVVTAGQRIPQVVHGAVYFYVGMLHGAFLLLGNHIVVGVWLQIILQMTVFCLLFFMVRRTAGSVAALTVLGVCTCSPYMIRSTLVLSPDMLFLCMFTVVLCMITDVKGSIRPELFLLLGIPISFCAYADVMGWWLLPAAVLAVISGGKEGKASGRKIAAVILCVLGAFLSFLVIAYADAFLSGMSITNVLQAWGSLYEPQSFHLPVCTDVFTSEPESMILSVMLSFGIFSFWCDQKNDRLSAWIIMAGTLAAAGCFGIFTDEMPGYPGLYLFLAVLAGTGTGQCFRGFVSEKSGQASEKKCGTDKAGQEGMNEEKISTSKEDKEVKNTGEADKKQVRYIENPLPLPKKHKKQVMDYSIQTVSERDDFDHPVSDEDDFDI